MSNECSVVVASTTEVPKEFARIANEVNVAFRQFVQQKLKQHKFDLTFEMLQIIVHLWENDGDNQQEIANATLKDKASLTYLIDNLTRRELVYRQEDTNDRRNKLIFLTPQGWQLKKVILPWVEDMYVAANAGIPTYDFEKAMHVLRRVVNNLKESQS